MVPNEKLTELLFNRYFLQSFGLAGMILYARSSREEYEKGYDARLTSSQSFTEVFLQFKRRRLTAHRFPLSTSPHQHRNLRKRPSRSSYYVGHTFRDLPELERAQQDARASREFLKYFILIDITDLDPQLTGIVYERNEQSRLPRTVSASCYGRRVRVRSEQYFTGTAFREAFSRRHVGAHTSLTAEGELCEDMWATQGNIKDDVALSSGRLEQPDQTWRPMPSLIRGMSAVGSQAEGNRRHFGLLYRNPDGHGQVRPWDRQGDQWAHQTVSTAPTSGGGRGSRPTPSGPGGLRICGSRPAMPPPCSSVPASSCAAEPSGTRPTCLTSR